jgi:hypothetical protein
MDILKLSQYQERSYAESANSKGFVNYGDDNLFPQYLIDLFHSSSTHNALTTTIATMVFGEGFDATTLDGRLAFNQWNLNDELRKACVDFQIQGGFALEVNWSLDRTTIANVSHLPFENIRSGFVNEEEKVEYYYYSKDWSSKRAEVDEICTFDPERKLDHPTQILYVKPFSPGSFYYPKPCYTGSIDYIELDKEIGKYHINNMLNGMAPSYRVHFLNGIPPEEERNRIRMDIERQMTGAGNAGKFIVTYSDDPERRPIFEPFELSDAHNQYQFLSEEVTAKIMVGHRVTNPQMFGVAVPGKLGGGGELAESAALFEQNVIAPNAEVVSSTIQTLMRASGIETTIIPLGAMVEEANVAQSYTGIQISSALDVISKVGTGELTKAQATQLLVSMLGFGLDQATALFESELNLSSDEVNLDASWEFLDALGEDISDDWELIDEVEVDDNLEAARDALWAFAERVPGDSNRKSEMDNEIVRIRYKYDGGLSDDSREFCKKMVRAQRVWRKEDIQAAGGLAVNPGFGPGGSDTYSIWEFKGGPWCSHRWIRQTYLKKDNNRKVDVAEAKRIISRLPIEERKANQIKSEVGGIQDIKPRNMPNNGYLNPR